MSEEQEIVDLSDELKYQPRANEIRRMGDNVGLSLEVVIYEEEQDDEVQTVYRVFHDTEDGERFGMELAEDGTTDEFILDDMIRRMVSNIEEAVDEYNA